MEEMLKAEQNRLRTISPSLRDSVERMIAYLKEEKVALTACTPALAGGARVRKFLTILNAMLRDQQPFRV